MCRGKERERTMREREKKERDRQTLYILQQNLKRESRDRGTEKETKRKPVRETEKMRQRDTVQM